MIYFSDFGGVPLRKIEPVRVALNAGTGTQDITVTGFGTPTGAIFFMVKGSSAGAETADARMSIGVTDGTNHWCISNSATASGSHSGQKFATNRIAGELNPNGDTDDSVIVFDSWITDGVRVNITDARANACYLVVWLIGGGATASVGTYAYSASATTKTPGFQSNLIFMAGTAVPTGSTANTCVWNYGIGAFDGSTITQCSAATAYSTPANTGQNAGKYRSDKIMTSYSGGLTEESVSPVTLSNITSTSFDLTAGGTVAGDYFGYIAIGGLSEAWVGIINAPTATGSSNLTNGSAGFTPTMGMFLTRKGGTANTNYTDGTAGPMGFGMATANGQESVHWRTKDNDGSRNTWVVADSKAVLHLSHAGAIDTYNAIGSLTGFVSDGATINFTTKDATAEEWIVAYAA